ncbi:MAG: hypothetical protein AVDCRST_MAG77-55, partial [uncultured Chloroflexi bacterium]
EVAVVLRHVCPLQFPDRPGIPRQLLGAGLRHGHQRRHVDRLLGHLLCALSRRARLQLRRRDHRLVAHRARSWAGHRPVRRRLELRRAGGAGTPGLLPHAPQAGALPSGNQPHERQRLGRRALWPGDLPGAGPPVTRDVRPLRAAQPGVRVHLRRLRHPCQRTRLLARQQSGVLRPAHQCADHVLPLPQRAVLRRCQGAALHPHPRRLHRLHPGGAAARVELAARSGPAGGCRGWPAAGHYRLLCRPAPLRVRQHPRHARV